MIRKRAELLHIRQQFFSSSSANTSLTPAHEDRPPLRTSTAVTAPLQPFSAVAVIAYRIKWPASAALSYGKGRNGR
jgi:hypothetical protein